LPHVNNSQSDWDTVSTDKTTQTHFSDNDITGTANNQSQRTGQSTSDTKTKKMEPAHPNIHQTILEISTNYWVYFIAIVLILAISRKAGQLIWKTCSAKLSKHITES